MNSKVKTCVLIISVLSLFFCGLAQADETDLVWSTYLGGSFDEFCYGLAVDHLGHVYVTGATRSSDFPITAGAYDTSYAGGGPIYGDVFVARLNQSGSALDYGTFLGGSDQDYSVGIAVDDSGHVYLTGSTYSADFPTTAGAFDTTYNGGPIDVFVTKLNPTGSDLVYSTFLGGSGYKDDGFGIAIDKSGNAYVTGWTSSIDFPTTAGALDTTYGGGEHDAFVVKLNPIGSALVYATFLGGTDLEYGFGIAVDGLGHAYISGGTYSADFPTTAGAFDTTHNGEYDVFVAKLNSTGDALDYATFLGGADIDRGFQLAVDSAGHAYVTGYTWSYGFPTTAGAFDTTHDGISNVIVAKLNPTGGALVYSTLLGTNDEAGHGIVVNYSGYAYVIGYTASLDFPTTAGAYDTTQNGSRDIFVVKLNSAGSALDYSTFLGGSNYERGMGIGLDSAGFVYVTGYTLSSNFPTTAGAFDPAYNDGWDAIVAKLDLSGYPVPVILTSFQATGGQGFITLNWITASEINCHRWEVYRSQQEAGEYTKIGELPGQGSTETAHTYQWVDRQLTAGLTHFYKLRQVDFDGSSWWSHVVSATAGSTVPMSYALHQNYPNPFNPVTEIRYAIPRDEHVTLKVYNVLGAEVVTLVDADRKANSYMVRWDAGELANGVYFCRMSAGDYSKTIKMVLLK